MKHNLTAGDVFRSEGIQMFLGYDRDEYGAPTVERWEFANSPDDPNGGYGYLQVTVMEIVPTVFCGTLAVYRRQWFGPDDEPMSAGRRVAGSLSSLKALLSRRRMTRRCDCGSYVARPLPVMVAEVAA